MYPRLTALVLCIFLLTLPLFAERPAWIEKLPFTDDAFWGMGVGETPEEAEKNAKRDILMQLSSQVKAVISLQSGDQAAGGAEESLNAYFGSNTLRGAELEDEYSEGGRHWTLMKYCDSCGEMLMKSAVFRYEEEIGYESEAVIESLADERVKDAVKIQRRLSELDMSEYRSEYIDVRPADGGLRILILNFLPDRAQLSPEQKASLARLSTTLFEQLKELPVGSVEVVGHANPTGLPDEAEQLEELSRNRAETMAEVLSASGFDVSKIEWRGGEELIGDPADTEGAGRNRRVEILVIFISEV